MAIKLALGLVVAVAMAAALQGCGPFGGGSSKSSSSPSAAARPGSVPTATPPAQLPEPILLGAISDNGGPSGTPGAGGTPASGGAASYTVKSGDTLSAIAASQNIPGDQQAAWIAEVLRLNNKTDANLKVGEDLTLPRAGGSATPTTNRTGTPGTATAGSATPTRTGTPGTPAAGTPTPTPRAGTTPTSGGSNTYTVKSGDTAGAIASSLGVPSANQAQWIAQMLQMNNTTATGLQIGQVLQLPPIPGAPSTTGSSSGTTPTTTPTPR